jgi:hypothetical protein
VGKIAEALIEGRVVAWFADSLGSPPSSVQVSNTRVFFNSVELRGNVWATKLH